MQIFTKYICSTTDNRFTILPPTIQAIVSKSTRELISTSIDHLLTSFHTSMTIVTDFDIGEQVMLENGETGTVTSIRILVRESLRAGKAQPDYKVEYEVDHNFVRYSSQLRAAE